MKILVRRAGAFGDVLDTTPVVARLRKEYPYAVIDFATDHPNAYANNPHVDHIVPSAYRMPFYDRVIDLDGSYERRLRKVPAIDCYMEDAFGDRGGDRQIVFDFNREAAPPCFHDKPWGKTIVVHPYQSAWHQRTLPRVWWGELYNMLAARDWNIIWTGTPHDHRFPGMLYAISPRQQAAVIHAAACFVCVPSGLMSLAMATKAPIVALCTMTPPAMMQYDRFGVRGWGFHPVAADIECAGCDQFETEARPFFPCRLGHNKCIESFDVAKVADTVERAIHENRDHPGDHV